MLEELLVGEGLDQAGVEIVGLVGEFGHLAGKRLQCAKIQIQQKKEQSPTARESRSETERTMREKCVVRARKINLAQQGPQGPRSSSRCQREACSRGTRPESRLLGLRPGVQPVAASAANGARCEGWRSYGTLRCSNRFGLLFPTASWAGVIVVISAGQAGVRLEAG